MCVIHIISRIFIDTKLFLIYVTLRGHEVSIILASNLLSDMQEDDRALISHADHTEDR